MKSKLKPITVKEWLELTYQNNEYNTRPRAKCKDGFSVSIQGGTKFHYCDPRVLCNKYFELELGFPSVPFISLRKYSEQKDCEGVYGYVPIKLIEKQIAYHGGIVNYKKFLKAKPDADLRHHVRIAIAKKKILAKQ